MGLKVNGCTVEWTGYEYGVRLAGGEIEECDTHADGVTRRDELASEGISARLVFWTLYVDSAADRADTGTP